MKRIFVYICLLSLGLNFPAGSLAFASHNPSSLADSVTPTTFNEIKVVTAEAVNVVLEVAGSVGHSICDISITNSLTQIQETVTSSDLLVCNKFQAVTEVPSYPSLTVALAPSGVQNISIAVEDFNWDHYADQGEREQGLVAILPANGYLGTLEVFSLSVQLAVPLILESSGKFVHSVSSLAEIQVWRC